MNTYDFTENTDHRGIYKDRSRPNPFTPKPPHREHPVVEELVTPKPLHHHDERPHMVKPYPNQPHAELNRMYGTLRTDMGWLYAIDNYAKGNVTSVAGSQVASLVTLLANLPETRLMRWPGAVAMYLVLRSVAIAPSSPSFATLGSLDCYYQDTIGGQVIPLGTISNNGTLQLTNINLLIQTPITDAGIVNVGNVLVTLSGGATVGTYAWQAAFAYAYLLPTTKPYDIVQMEDLLDGHAGNVR